MTGGVLPQRQLSGSQRRRSVPPVTLSCDDTAPALCEAIPLSEARPLAPVPGSLFPTFHPKASASVITTIPPSLSVTPAGGFRPAMTSRT